VRVLLVPLNFFRLRAQHRFSFRFVLSSVDDVSAALT
jgi:hypothetical protein